MSEVRDQEAETAVLMDDPPVETISENKELAAEQTEADESIVFYLGHLLLRALAVLFMLRNSDNDDSVPRGAVGNLTNETEEFILGVQEFFRNILGMVLYAETEELFRQLLPAWNTFLQPVQGERSTSAIISSDIKGDISRFIPRCEELEGAQWTEGYKKWIKQWLPRWNMFLQARAGVTPVTCGNVCLTIVGLIFYILDLGSDIGTSMYYASNGQWWRAIVTLTLVYGAVIFYTVWKWNVGLIPCTGAAAWLRYVASLLVNWPDVKQYWALCLLEWKMYKSPASSARLVPDWHERRVNVAYLKFTEGLWEACPQAMLQLCLLVPDLYGDWTWTDYLRIAGASVSLCTAGAAVVNREKFHRINIYTDLPPSELVVLHVWAVPVTVSRLLSVALLVSVHPYWALTGVTLHLVLYGADWCRTRGVPRTLTGIISICVFTLLFFISPFTVVGSVTYRRVLHAIHFLGNTAVTVVWALGTPLVCAHPALYTAIICVNAVMFAVGLVGWQIHENYWRR